MYFRFRGNSIQIVKSQMDPSTGKAKSVPLGSINRSNLAISEKLSASCSKRELEEIQAWVEHHRSVDDLKRKFAALTLPEQIAAAIEWFTEASPEDAGQIAADVIAATMALRQVIVKRGLA
jgi:hypothetical protein